VTVGRFSVYTAPTVEPVTLGEAKVHLRLDPDTTHPEDDLIAALIVAAREYVESQTDRALIATVFDYTLDEFPDGWFLTIPKASLSAVASVKYYDADGVLTTWSSTNYVVRTGDPGEVHLTPTGVWPVTEYRPGAVVIRCTIGYGTTAASVPASVRAAILLMVAHLYEHREAVVTGTIATDIPLALGSLLASVSWGARP
jgi:uncharacterized phiE125 gp8 family phage protein